MLNKKDPYDRHEIHYAANDNNPSKVKELISSGADINHKDKNGWTPLHFAAQAKASTVALLLIDAGAEIDAQNIHGNTPLWVAIINYKGDDSNVIELLLKRGANPHIKNNAGKTPIELAKLIANYDVAKYFNNLTQGCSLKKDFKSSLRSGVVMVCVPTGKG